MVFATLVAQVRTAASELRVLPIHVDDHPVTSMDRVRSSARMLQSKGKCDFIIIDYLQLCDMRTEQNNRNREQEVAQANYPNIRLMTVSNTISLSPSQEFTAVGGGWQVCSSVTIREFSATAYFFGREIARTQQVPVEIGRAHV